MLQKHISKASAVLLALLALSACGKSERSTSPVQPAVSPVAVSPVDGAAALERVKQFVALGPRVPGTPGAVRAAEYLAGELKTLGIEPAIDTFEEQTPRGPVTFRNVTGLIRGTGGGLIVIGSHYDTKGGIADSFVGANDSGSSTGLLLELASLLAKGPRVSNDVMVAFFDGEECAVSYSGNDGFHGSRRLASRLSRDGSAGRVTAVIILDMIGDADLNVILPRNSSGPIATAVFEAARVEGVRQFFGLGDTAILDDHVPFLSAGMPAVDLIDFNYGSAPGKNDYWHTHEDTMDKLSPASLAIVGRTVLRTVHSLR